MKDLIAYCLLVLAFLANHLLEHLGLSNIWLRSYLDDLLAAPIVLKTALLGVQLMVPRQRQYTISIWDSVATVAVFSVYFEFFLPRYNDLYTQDFLDVVCYSLGGLFFHRVLNTPLARGPKIARRVKRPWRAFALWIQQQGK